MTRTHRAVDQYLDRYAESEISIAAAVPRRFGHVLTIPAAGEAASLRNVLNSIPPGPLGDVLVVLIVNGSLGAPRWITDANLTLLEQLYRDWGSGQACTAHARLFDRSNGALLLVDRASPSRELPAKQGVGLARKIGADLALALWRTEKIESPWIHCTDADVNLPSDYFEQSVSASPEAAALAYAYRHVVDGIEIVDGDADQPAWLRQAALEYEISLRYYVRGLAYAKSPFAFHTIGSTIAIRASAYAEVRGFPKRLAAEDFYVLNKLAKVGPIEVLTGSPIELSSRVSHRVPFGTGRALADASPSDSRLLYHPVIFGYLAAWESTLTTVSQSPDAEARATLLHSDLPGGIDEQILEDALDSIGALGRSAVRAGAPNVRLRQLHYGFDAGRTLKLVHALRERAFPSLPLQKAIEEAPFVEISRPEDVQSRVIRPEFTALEEIARVLGRP